MEGLLSNSNSSNNNNSSNNSNNNNNNRNYNQTIGSNQQQVSSRSGTLNGISNNNNNRKENMDVEETEEEPTGEGHNLSQSNPQVTMFDKKRKILNTFIDDEGENDSNQNNNNNNNLSNTHNLINDSYNVSSPHALKRASFNNNSLIKKDWQNNNNNNHNNNNNQPILQAIPSLIINNSDNNNNDNNNNNNTLNSLNTKTLIYLNASNSNSSENLYNLNNNQQNQHQEEEEIKRERLERDKMLHEDADIDRINYSVIYKYGDGEEGETYEQRLNQSTNNMIDDGRMYDIIQQVKDDEDRMNDDKLQSRQDHDDLSANSLNNNNNSNSEESLQLEKSCDNSCSNTRNNTDDEEGYDQHVDHDGNSNHNTDDDSGNMLDESRTNSPSHRANGDNEFYGITSIDGNDPQKTPNSRDGDDHDGMMMTSDGNTEDGGKSGGVATPSHTIDDEDGDEEDDDIPLRIQTCANNKSHKLSLSNCWLKIIPTDVWSLTELRDLDLSANHLKKVSKSIGTLIHLKRLRLNHNQLTVLPKELYTLTRLTTLYLNNNNIKAIPKDIRNLTSLRILDLSFNQITDIPSATNFNLMLSLNELRLRYNQISSLPSNMLECTQLQVLWLEGNRLPLQKNILKKSPIEILTFLKQYKPKMQSVAKQTKQTNQAGGVTKNPPPSIDTASTIAVAQVIAQKEIDIKKRKKENIDDIKKQHIETEAKLKQLEEELVIANAKATKFEEEAAVLHQLHQQQQTNIVAGSNGNGVQVANLPQILLSTQHQLWDATSVNSPPPLNTTPTSLSPTLVSTTTTTATNSQQNVTNAIAQISLLSPTHTHVPPNLNILQQSPPPPQNILHQHILNQSLPSTNLIPQQQQQQQQQQLLNQQNINIPQQQQQPQEHQFAVPTILPPNKQLNNQSVQTIPPQVVVVEKTFEWEVPLSEIVLGNRIGRGGYGQVFRGNWRGTEVAVKMLFNDNLNPKLLNDLRKEVDLLCKLRHPNIVLFMGACTVPESPCIVTEYLSRGSLANILQDETIQMEWGLRLQLAFDTARGMTYLHSRNPVIIHRDLKTDNLLVDDSWQVKVADFGLATVKSNTFAKTMCGTTGWVAPEVLAEEGYTEKADVYSFAIVLWELLTRQIPYAGKNTMQVVRSIDRGERLALPDWCPPGYGNLINRCWDTDPANRPSFPEILPIMESLIQEFQAEKKDALANGKPIPYVGPPKSLDTNITTPIQQLQPVQQPQINLYQQQPQPQQLQPIQQQQLQILQQQQPQPQPQIIQQQPIQQTQFTLINTASEPPPTQLILQQQQQHQQ